MSGVYVPGAFSKKKEVLPIPVEVPVEVSVKKEELKPEPKPQSQKEVIGEIKPVELKPSIWGGKKSFAECLKISGDIPNEDNKETKPVVKYSQSRVQPFFQKEIKKEELDFFMDKYDGKLRKLYEKFIYYDKDFFDKLRINGDQGYLSFCKFMFHVI